MSQNAFTPPSRPPSSASSSSTSNNVPRVHGGSGKQQQSYGSGGGHDHTRPLPPPRLSETTTANNNTLTSNNASSSSSVTSLSSVAPLTAPLAPLSTNSSFRSVTNSRNSTTGGTTGTATTSNNNNNNNNNNNINNNISNNSNNNNSSNNTSAPRHVQSNNSGSVNVVASSATGTSTSRVPSSTRPNLGEVTLTVPRPELERVVNEYVETPFRQANPAAVNSLGNLVSSNQKCLKNERRLHHHHHHHHQQQQHHHHLHHQLNHQRQINDQRGQQQSQEAQQQQQQQQQQQRSELGESRKSPTTGRNPVVGTQARNRESGGGVPTTRRQQSHLLQSSLSVVTSSGGGGAGGGVVGVGGVVVGAVTKQPVSFTKEPSSVLGSSSLGPVTALGGRLNNDPNLSIMCDFCGRCRCESCRQPPPLPSRWLCDNSCFCSAETALDYASCLCCVKGLFYHCADSGSGTDSEAGGNCADEPCSCTGPRRTARWACLGALTLVLPCLLCYWPLKGCVTVCEACYARHASQGCHCDPNAHGRHHNNTNAQSVVSRDSRDPEKRLLDPVTPEL